MLSAASVEASLVHQEKHASELHQQRPHYTLLFVDIAGWTAAAVGANASRAVRLQGDPGVLLNLRSVQGSSSAAARIRASPLYSDTTRTGEIG